MPAFDCQPVLHGNTLTLRPQTEDDLDPMFEAAGDSAIWALHPASDRYKREVFEPYFASLLETKKALVVIDNQTGKIVGGSSYYTPPDQPDSIAIGFTFLVREKWGGATNRELKQLMVEHAFSAYPIVYFHIAATNLRSQKATLKLGAVHLYDAVMNLSTAPKEWKCYGLTKEQWDASQRPEPRS
ncbi:GNAT family N-acetyltransferase [Pseudomonas sp. GB2N2]